MTYCQVFGLKLVDTMAQSFNQALGSMVLSIFQLVGVLIAMFVLCGQLGFITIATAAFNLLVIVIFFKLAQKYFVRQKKYFGAVNGTIEETFSGQAIIKAFNAQNRAEKQFDHFRKKVY